MKYWLPLLTLFCVSCAKPKEVEIPAPIVEPVESSAVVEVKKKAVPKALPKKEPVVKRGEVTEVLVEQVFALRAADQALLIDTRPTVFYTLGHIDGAVSVPLKSFDKSFLAKKDEIDSAVSAGKVLVIYCANETCVDSHKMSQELAAKGYDTSVFKGGWELWKQTGLE